MENNWQQTDTVEDAEIKKLIEWAETGEEIDVDDDACLASDIANDCVGLPGSGEIDAIVVSVEEDDGEHTKVVRFGKESSQKVKK